MNYDFSKNWYDNQRAFATLNDGVATVAAELVADPQHELLVASPYASVRVHQNFFRRLAGLPEFP